MLKITNRKLKPIDHDLNQENVKEYPNIKDKSSDLILDLNLIVYLEAYEHL